MKFARTDEIHVVLLEPKSLTINVAKGDHIYIDAGKEFDYLLQCYIDVTEKGIQISTNGVKFLVTLNEVIVTK